MKKIYIILFCFLFAGKIQAQSDVYMHGTYDDVDWETLEFVGPRAAAMEKIYYNYPESRQGRITLRKQSAYRSKGIYYYTVMFPNIATIYTITLNPAENTCIMRDEKGTYYKEFFRPRSGLEPDEINKHPQQILIQKVKRFIGDNAKYCSNAECDELMNRGNEIKFSIYEKDMKFIFGDVNGDNILDAIMNAPITQCDGGNGCCLCVEYIAAISQRSGKHLIKTFEFPNNGYESIYAPLRIEKRKHIYKRIIQDR